MVLLSNQVSDTAFHSVVDELADKYQFRVVNRWDAAPLGFVCEGLKPSKLDKLALDANVSIIEEDFSFAQPIVSGLQYSTWNGQYLWHLDRLDEPTYFVNDSNYNLCPEARTIYAYVIDQGVYRDHEQFTYNEPTNRVVHSRAFDDGSTNGYVDTTNGCTVSPNRNLNMRHGTAVASVLAGTTVGAAKTQVVSLRVFGCNGLSQGSWIVNAVRWVRNSRPEAPDDYRFNAGLVNLSAAIDPLLSASDFSNLNAAVQQLVTGTQIPFFTSANNYAGDACQFSPAALAYTNNNHGGVVFSVGGTALGGQRQPPPAPYDRNDYRLQLYAGDGVTPLIGPEAGSNGGSCVSMYAPAMDIYVAVTDNPTAYLTLRGTSFASPLAAGVAARYMEQTGIRNYTQVYDYLLSRAASTGTAVFGTSTEEYWMCFSTASNQYLTYRSNPGACPAGSRGLNGTSTPVHFPATTNTSGAGMIYSDMTCP